MKFEKKSISTYMLIGTTFLLMLFYNVLSPHTSDDYSYMFSSTTGERITNIFQIMDSLTYEYMYINGRVAPHFLVHVLLIGPKWIFNIINAGVFTCLLWLMQSVSGKEKPTNKLMWLGSYILLWVFLPAYGQVFFWLTGSINYGWCYALALIYVKFYIDLFINPEKMMNSRQLIALCIFGLLFGAYSAQVSFTVVFICFIMLSLVMHEKKSIKKYCTYLAPICSAAIGYLTMLASPAEMRRVPQNDLKSIFVRMMDIFETYYLCSQKLIIIWSILLVLAVCFGVGKKRIVISILFMFVSVISAMMLFAAGYIDNRHYANSVFFEIVAIIVLMQLLSELDKEKCIPYCLCAYLIASSLWILWEGSYDIFQISRLQIKRDAYLAEQVDSNTSEKIYVPLIIPETKYSCKYGIIDLQVNEGEVWPNAAIAKYYGVDEIYGMK